VADRYQALANSPLAGAAVKRLGLPVPPPLERREAGRPPLLGPVLVGSARGGRLLEPAIEALRDAGVRVETDASDNGDGDGPAALLFDASGIDAGERLRALYDFFHPTIRGLRRGGRAVVLAAEPGAEERPRAATAQRAIEGFTRSLGKEVGGRGATSQLLRAAVGAEAGMASTLRFLLSPRSAYVSGQVVRLEAVDPGDVVAPDDWERPLAGRVAAVTGAARGIGEAIATTLAGDGAEVVCVDVPAAGEALSAVANRLGGTAVRLDVTDPGAAARLADHLDSRHGRVDAIVHNAGITRDKTLGRMGEEQWDAVIGVNLTSQERINDALLERDLIDAGGRIVSVSSVSGIAGNRGQTNYATSKAGVIGMVEALAPVLRERGATVNAVAPGFIETAMTAAMPIATREVGRRANSLLQGGRPVDVAETIAWLAAPASTAVNGNVVRVCGQQILGA
jgi:3-oxoacyl-[acyl-carrier protein] reductase